MGNAMIAPIPGIAMESFTEKDSRMANQFYDRVSARERISVPFAYRILKMKEWIKQIFGRVNK